MVSNAPPTRRRHHFRLADDVCKIHFEPKVGGQGGADYASIKRGSLSCTFFYYFFFDFVLLDFVRLVNMRFLCVVISQKVALS